MKVAVSSDHAGFALKARLLEEVNGAGHQAIDLGVHTTDPSDYPDAAAVLGSALIEGRAERGVLVCGSGVGASVAANKIPGVRAGLCHDAYSAHQGVEHDDMNVLCLGSRIVGEELAAELVRTFLQAQFQDQEERFVRRLNKVLAIEERYSRHTQEART